MLPDIQQLPQNEHSADPAFQAPNSGQGRGYTGSTECSLKVQSPAVRRSRDSRRCSINMIPKPIYNNTYLNVQGWIWLVIIGPKTLPGYSNTGWCILNREVHQPPKWFDKQFGTYAHAPGTELNTQNINNVMFSDTDVVPLRRPPKNRGGGRQFVTRDPTYLTQPT